MSAELTEHPCAGCGSPTLNEKLCRECDIEMLFWSSSCRECEVFLMREELSGPLEKQHKAGCSLATSKAPYNTGEWPGVG